MNPEGDLTRDNIVLYPIFSKRLSLGPWVIWLFFTIFFSCIAVTIFENFLASISAQLRKILGFRALES
jgi:hypothetical protein